MLKKILCGASLLCAAGFSNAAVITETFTVAPTTTNFTNSSVQVAKFDTNGGNFVLNSVTFTVAGTVEGIAEVESRDAQPATVVATLSAELTLLDSMMNTLVVTIPSVSDSFNATAYDNIDDFGGTSGFTFADLDGSQTNSATFSDMGTLATYSGSAGDMINFVFNASATSVATGAGNLLSSFTTQAGGLITVAYDYTDMTPPPVPVSAPAHVALLGLGLLAFAGVRKSRK